MNDFRAAAESAVSRKIHEARGCGPSGHHFGSSRCRAVAMAQGRVEQIMAAVADEADVILWMRVVDFFAERQAR